MVEATSSERGCLRFWRPPSKCSNRYQPNYTLISSGLSSMADLKRNLTQLYSGNRADLRVAEIIPRPPNVLKRRFPVVASSTGLQQATNYLLVASKRFKGLKTDPWIKYRKFMKLNQAGLATIIYHNTGHRDRYLLVTIKEEKADKDQFGQLLSFNNANMVNLPDICYFEQTVHLIYEHVNVSLRQIQSTPRGSLNHCKISLICKEVRSRKIHWMEIFCSLQIQVLNGLEYIHLELQVFHGALDCGNILVGSDRSVKIGKLHRLGKSA